MSEMLKWLIAVDLDASIQEVRKQLEKSGFVIDSVLADVGCITGQANQETVTRSRKVVGVLDISPDFEVQLSPPDEVTTL